MKIVKTEINYTLIKKYFEGKTSGEESAAALEWMNDPENKFLFDKYFHQLWKDNESAEDTLPGSVYSSLLGKIHHQIHLEEFYHEQSWRSPGNGDQKVRIKKLIGDLGKIAAIFMVPVLLFMGVQIYNQNNWLKNQKETLYTEIRCPLGAISRFELPDGTTGSLNNGSSLRYPDKFKGELREVELEGEAFFDVTHNKQMPFIIKTSGLDVKVLGTRVNVYSYPDESYQEVTLESGSVELVQQEEEQEVVLAKMRPGQHVHFNYRNKQMGNDPGSAGQQGLHILDGAPAPDGNRDGQVVLRLAEGDMYLVEDDPDRYTGWTGGKLILRNDPMPVLLRRMERWYSVKFNILDPRINDFTYRATFEEENLDQVLKLLSLTGPLEFSKLPRKQMADGTFMIQEVNVSIK